jgi:hypothetical protein
MLFIINFIASWTILSLGGAIVSGILPPLALSINIRLPGLNSKLSSFNLMDNSTKNSHPTPSSVSGVIPGVMLPGLLFMLLYANCKK